jgi:hypothetical protein
MNKIRRANKQTRSKAAMVREREKHEMSRDNPRMRASWRVTGGRGGEREVKRNPAKQIPIK